MVKVLDCDLEVSKLEFQLSYYFPFRTNTLGKGMNTFIPSTVSLFLFYKDGFGIFESWHMIKQRDQTKEISSWVRYLLFRFWNLLFIIQGV